MYTLCSLVLLAHAQLKASQVILNTLLVYYYRVYKHSITQISTISFTITFSLYHSFPVIRATLMFPKEAKLNPNSELCTRYFLLLWVLYSLLLSNNFSENPQSLSISFLSFMVYSSSYFTCKFVCFLFFPQNISCWYLH